MGRHEALSYPVPASLHDPVEAAAGRTPAGVRRRALRRLYEIRSRQPGAGRPARVRLRIGPEVPERPSIRCRRQREDRWPTGGQNGASRSPFTAGWAYGHRLARLREIAPDAILLAGADIVPPAVLEIPKLGTINGHYGLLPRYRGMNVTEWSIYHDDPVGVSVHLVDSGIDTGPIVARSHCRSMRASGSRNCAPSISRGVCAPSRRGLPAHADGDRHRQASGARRGQAVLPDAPRAQEAGGGQVARRRLPVEPSVPGGAPRPSRRPFLNGF